MAEGTVAAGRVRRVDETQPSQKPEQSGSGNLNQRRWFLCSSIAHQRLEK